MTLREHIGMDDNGRTIKRWIDEDGCIIDEMYLSERWIRPGQSVYVRDNDRKEDQFKEGNLGRKPHHIKLYCTNIQYVLKSVPLSVNARAAFLSCIAYLDWNNNFVVEQGKPLSGRDIANLTGMNKDAMNRGLRELQDAGIVAMLSSGKGKAQHYVVNPSLAWRGRAVAKDMAQIAHFKANGLKLPVKVKYSEAPVL